MSVQEIPDEIFYRLIEQTVDTKLVWDKDTQIGSYYISIHDKYSFESGRDVNIYKILSSTQADVYKANKYNYQSSSKPDTSVPQPKPPEQPPLKNKSLYQSITIDGLPIARVICNNHVIWSQSVEQQEVYNITAYVDASVSKLNDSAIIDYNRDFAAYGVNWSRVDRVAVEVDDKIVAKLQAPVYDFGVRGGTTMSVEKWDYPSNTIEKYKNPTFKISQH
ncbi:TPA: hypothetical protein ACQN7J_001128 [Streptococcus pyogenes]|uniref:Phage protein n=1 Tax=Streptococcus pyogenes TaxID=1314 RepID=A0A660A2A3_STRPY|nr:hypothetical protein [Streptococcus pyogenes]EPZ46871.1 hypothetical protein HMPREF1229_0770 [Streptococcus pyogenes GA40634]ERL18954.1 hypothetical protein HMPREF1227_0246 [Streptococcus pyogenes GA41046]QBX19974.1 hypothetical protein Javan503_0053 [Streptococcus phage Javan503]HER4522544.1 hypothetical protein [Streptococcus pyogenes NGAS760]HER4526497.1 hypothetical protein [Streptococcus pyogenes NGAS758]HER4529829.1 hypothetical protein [Streptococcus pyogenes NGAS746]HER4531542.1 h